jgi:hypothetical protein
MSEMIARVIKIGGSEVADPVLEMEGRERAETRLSA